MSKANFDAILKEVGWRLPNKAVIANIQEPVDVALSDDFEQIFPRFSQLMRQASATSFTANSEKYRLYSWIDKEGDSFGWLADMDIQARTEANNYDGEVAVNEDDTLPEHCLLLSNIGGMLETWNMPDDEDFLTFAKNFIFSLKHCYRFANQDVVYGEEQWIFEKIDESKQLPITDMVCFSEEANGNLTFYNKNDKKVYLLLDDHGFEYVEELDGHPEYSFYTIKGITSFVEYVELIASQMLSNIK